MIIIIITFFFTHSIYCIAVYQVQALVDGNCLNCLTSCLKLVVTWSATELLTELLFPPSVECALCAKVMLLETTKKFLAAMARAIYRRL